MSMKNSNDTMGNRTRDLPTCSAVPRPTALLRAPVFVGSTIICRLCKLILPDQAQFFLLLKSQSFRFSANIFSRSAIVVGGRGEKYFHRGPNPFSVALFNHVRKTSVKQLDIKTAQTCKFYEDDQELMPKHVGEIINP